MQFKIKSLIFLLVVGGAVYLLFFSKVGREYPRPSNLFYVNDFANTLSEGATDVILFYGENMYEDTKNLGEGRSQIVVATFAIEDVSDVANYDKTEIYREWKIGENDMGLLFLFFFVEEEIDGISYPTSEYYIAYEIGYRMEAYITTIEINNAITEALEGAEEYNNGIINFYSEMTAVEDYNYGIVNLYLEMTALVYEKAYPEDFYPMEYDMEYVANYIADYPEDATSLEAELSMNLITYLLSPYASWSGFFTYGGIALLVLALGGRFVYHSGGGGSSGGKGGFRRGG